MLIVTCEHGVPGLAQRVEEPDPAARPARRAVRALGVAAVGDVGVGLVVVVVVVVIVAVVVVVVDVVGHVDHRVDRLHDEGEKAERGHPVVKCQLFAVYEESLREAASGLVLLAKFLAKI